MKASRVQPVLTPTEDKVAPNLSWDWMCVKERAQLIDNGGLKCQCADTVISHCLQHCQSCITQINGWCKNMTLSRGAIKVKVRLIRISAIDLPCSLSVTAFDFLWEPLDVGVQDRKTKPTQAHQSLQFLEHPLEAAALRNKHVYCLHDCMHN